MGIYGFNTEDAQALQRQLGKFISNSEEKWDGVIAQWEILQECWCDNQYIKFEQEFERLSNQYRQTKKECEDYYKFLDKKIEDMKKVPTLSEHIEVGMAIVSSVGSLLNGGPIPSQPSLPISPVASYVQTVQAKKDPLSTVVKVETPVPPEDLAAQHFNARPQLMRPMELDDQLEEMLESNKDEEDRRRRREMDASTVEKNKPKASGSA